MKIARVLGSTNQKLKEKVVNFWISQNCMSEEEAKNRIHGALAAILDDNNDIIGVCSGRPIYVEQLRDWFLYYRSFTKPEFRNLDISKYLLNSTFEGINKSESKKILGDKELKGIYIVFENDILNENVKEYITSDAKLIFIGFNDKNQQLRVRYFDGTTLN